MKKHPLSKASFLFASVIAAFMGLTSAGCGSSDSAAKGNTTIYLFNSGSTTFNVANSTITRAAVDAGCVNAGAPSACTHKTAAFMSFSSSDQISSFATQLGLPSGKVVGPTGTVIADSWSALLQGTLQASPVTAGAFPNSSYHYYLTASHANGSYYSTQDCAGWTGASGGAGVGDATKADSTAIEFGSSTCNVSVAVLCLCY